jgi:hypothetical protein
MVIVGETGSKETLFLPDSWSCETLSKLNTPPGLRRQLCTKMVATSPRDPVTEKTAVPTPNTGRDPDTPMTSIAQALREMNASAHEHKLCPAPEST